LSAQHNNLVVPNILLGTTNLSLEKSILYIQEQTKEKST
jgi:hypothetical protein